MGLKIRGAIFDLDGLMIDTEGLSLMGWRELLAPFGHGLTQEQYDLMVGMDVEWTAQRVIELTGLKLDRSELAKRHMVSLTEMVRTSARPQPGLIDLVAMLKKKGLRLAIASNGTHAYLDAALAAIGLQGTFACIVSIEDVKQGKPEPDVFLAAALCLGLDPSECLALEDSPVGLAAAQAAGMTCFVVPTPGQRFDETDLPYYRFASLQEVDGQVLDRLLGGVSNGE